MNPVRLSNPAKLFVVLTNNISLKFTTVQEGVVRTLSLLWSFSSANLATGAVILSLAGKVALGNQKLDLGNLTLYGEQVGSYFGGSIAIADLNNDK